MKRPRIIPPVYLLAAILAMLALHFLWPVRQIVPGWWRLTGIVPMACGVWLGVSIAATFSKRGTAIRPGDVSTQLVTDGPFRWSRNPIYVGMVLLLAGIAIALGSLTPWLALPVFVAVIGWNIIPVEEAMLGEAFGEAYTTYCATVRRWV